jgi:glucose/arabinose dehydrogenase
MNNSIARRSVARGLSRCALWFVLALCLSPALARHAHAQTLKNRLVASGLNNPLWAGSPPNNPDRIFIIEQRAKIRIADRQPNGSYTLRPTPFLDLTSQLTTIGLEYGLIGMAFHPDFAHYPYIYCVVTPNGTPEWAIWRFRVSASDPNLADLSSQQTVIFIDYPIAAHRSGWIDFGPDGYLYTTTGDGGENDSTNAASNLGVMRGKVLRIDVDGADNIPGNADDDAFPADANKNYSIPPTNPFISTAGALPEIWAYGIRNAWRCSFDRATGDLWIGDVGQGAREEIDFQPASSTGGEFYGWRCLEGTNPTNYAGCVNPLPPSVLPTYEYPHSSSGGPINGSAVVGGRVYRGCAIPWLYGKYMFGDWNGTILTCDHVGNTLANFVNRSSQLSPTGGSFVGTNVHFGEDALGELYFVIYGSNGQGAVYKIEPTVFVGPDCNANGVNDDCDIAKGTSLDANHNGVPDECDPPPPSCAADFDGDGTTTVSDLFAFLDAWFEQFGAGGAPGTPSADFDNNLTVEVADLFGFLDAWFTEFGVCGV